MNGFLIFFLLTIFSFAGYIVWPSRYNVLTHGLVSAVFIGYIVPAIILDVSKNFATSVVDLYIQILAIGLVSFLIGLIPGFFIGLRLDTRYSFDVMDGGEYEKRAIKITKSFLLVGIIGLALSYIIMGFVPIFADDPIAAKLFRGQYQAPYIKVAALFRTSFYILSSIMPIACIIWYKYRSQFILLCIIIGVMLMVASLQRSGAFSGIVFAFIIVMSFKSRLNFVIMMVVLFLIFIMSSFFYLIVGIKSFNSDRDVWTIIGASAPDIMDHLDFLTRFNDNPVWTYGRTMYGGLIPGHYKWNPAVYTLLMVNPGADINDIGSGGLRLPLPLWGYVSFSWIGVVTFSLFTGLFSGVFLGMLKRMFLKYESIVIRTISIVAFGSVFNVLMNFTLLSFYFIPPIIISVFYLYRFRK